MKKIIAIVAILLCLVSTAGAERYYRFGQIVDIEYDCDFVTVDDGMGNLWDFYSYPIASYNYYDDLVLMIMDDNNTPNWIYDDRVAEAIGCDVEDATEIIRRYREERSHITF